MTRHMARLTLDLARLLEGENDPELDFIATRVREIWGVLHRGGGTLEEHSSDLWDMINGPEAWEEAIEEERQLEAERFSERQALGRPSMTEDELVVEQARILEEHNRVEQHRREEEARRLAEEIRMAEEEAVAPELSVPKTRGRGRSKKATATDALRPASVPLRRGRSKKASTSDVENGGEMADDTAVAVPAVQKKRRGRSQESSALEDGDEAGIDDNAIAPISPTNEEDQGNSSTAHVAPVEHEDLEEQHEDMEREAPSPMIPAPVAPASIIPAKTRCVKDVPAPQPAIQHSVSTSTTRSTRNKKRKAGHDNQEDDTVAPPTVKKTRRARGDDLTINGTAAMAGRQGRVPITEYQDAKGRWWAQPGATVRPDWAFAERTV